MRRILIIFSILCFVIHPSCSADLKSPLPPLKEYVALAPYIFTCKVLSSSYEHRDSSSKLITWSKYEVKVIDSIKGDLEFETYKLKGANVVTVVKLEVGKKYLIYAGFNESDQEMYLWSGMKELDKEGLKELEKVKKLIRRTTKQSHPFSPH